MGDDAMNGEYKIGMPDAATLGDLMNVILHGGNGNDWPIPYTGANSFWRIQSNIGDLADIYTDKEGEWHIRYLAHTEETPLKDLGVTRTFGDNGLHSTNAGPAPPGCEKTFMTGKEIKDYLSDAYSRLGSYSEPVPGPRIRIEKYKKIQDETRYRVVYNGSFFKILDADTDLSLYYISYMKKSQDH